MNALAAAQSCTLVACPNPLQRESRVFAQVPAGQTLAEMIGPDASHSLAIEIGGHEVPRELWAHTRPKPGQTIHAINYPQGGGNGSKWIRTIAIAVISYYTFGAGGAGAANGGWLGVSAATYSVIGAIAIMAVTPMVGQAREVAA